MNIYPSQVNSLFPQPSIVGNGRSLDLTQSILGSVMPTVNVAADNTLSTSSILPASLDPANLMNGFSTPTPTINSATTSFMPNLASLAAMPTPTAGKPQSFITPVNLPVQPPPAPAPQAVPAAVPPNNSGASQLKVLAPLLLKLVQMLAKAKDKGGQDKANGNKATDGEEENPGVNAKKTDETSKPDTNKPASENADDVAGDGTINGVKFGVNARPTWGGSSYEKLSYDDQMKKLKEMGLKTYAFDVNSHNAEQSNEIIEAAKRNGIEIQANIGVDRNKLTSFEDAYAAAKAEGAAVGKLYGDKLKNFQLDNELDMWISPDGNANLDPKKYEIAKGIVQGLNDGLKSTDPDAETIVNSTQAPSGLAFLKKLQDEGTDWTYTGYHWYSPTGDDIENSGDNGTDMGTTVKNVHDVLGKPIWMTEFNGSVAGADGPSANRQKNSEIISKEMADIIEHGPEYGVVAANVHQLMDQPELGNSEAEYGLLDGNGNATASSEAIKDFMKKHDV